MKWRGEVERRRYTTKDTVLTRLRADASTMMSMTMRMMTTSSYSERVDSSNGAYIDQGQLILVVLRRDKRRCRLVLATPRST
jgi:hypothetical protein